MMATQMPYVGELGRLHRLVVLLVANRAGLIAAREEASRQIEVQLDKGLRLATLLRAALPQHDGIRSEKLAELGLQPFRAGTGRRSRPLP